MVGKNTITKVAFTGNTKLTYKCLKAVDRFLEIHAVFGLTEEKLKNKTNYFNLDEYCASKNIHLFKTNNWDAFKIFCDKNDIDLVISIGESRILPESITSSFDVIGNHGAVLPDVQGGASLVWGRLVNTGCWGVSIMRIDEGIDSGEILKVKNFDYDLDCTEFDFVEKCDDLTVEALVEVLKGNIDTKSNKQWDIKVNKHTDSYMATKILEYCLHNNMNVYMPPRTPDDCVINNNWSKKFIDLFKTAQNNPYPQWRQNEEDSCNNW